LNDAFLGIVIVIAGIAWIISKILDAVGPVTPIVFIVIIIAVAMWLKHAQKQKRIQYLFDKYGDEQIVQRIMNRKFWEGQTAQQLIDSVGNPLSIDKKSMVSRKREVWKYNSIGRSRYGLRITLDNDVVIGWDQKSG
jgi:hypothetical protein